MKITNKYHLPEALVRAVSHDRYEGGNADISVTTLIAPPQIRKLRAAHEEDIVEDASERIWSMMGSAVHYVVENAVETMKKDGAWNDSECVAEKRYYREYGDKTISGQIDLYEYGVLTDFKLTSIWAIKDAIYGGGKPEWDAQLNLQRWLMVGSASHLQITAIARDWNKSGMMRDENYPPRACNIEVPLWSDEKVDAYIQERLNAHFGKITPDCTPSECWESPTKYALMKKGRKSAVRLLEDRLLVMPYAAEKGCAIQDPDDGHWELDSKHYIDIRQGERRRCKDYCSVMPFCDQYKEWLGD